VERHHARGILRLLIREEEVADVHIFLELVWIIENMRAGGIVHYIAPESIFQTCLVRVELREKHFHYDGIFREKGDMK